MFTIGGAEWPDAVSAIAALLALPTALWGIWYAGGALKAQNEASDLQSALLLWDRIDHHWSRYREANTDHKMFEFGQLASYYELSCGLFRDQILSTKAARTLEEHLNEILPAMLEHPEFKVHFDAPISTPDTFDNITWFCKERQRRPCSLKVS